MSPEAFGLTSDSAGGHYRRISKVVVQCVFDGLETALVGGVFASRRLFGMSTTRTSGSTSWPVGPVGLNAVIKLHPDPEEPSVHVAPVF